MFPTGLTVSRDLLPTAPIELRPDDDLGEPGDLGDLGRPGRPDGRDEHRNYHARPGHRPGACPTITSARAGGAGDVVRPLLVAPRAASRIVLSGEVFALPLPHLRIDDGHDDAGLLVWTVTVAGDQLRPTPATLHLLGSPSMVVTVLELVPARRLRWSHERFVRYGVEAVDELADRIVQAA